MATTIKLEGEARSEFGKGVARRLRVANKIPATIYAGGEEPAFVTLPMRETTLALRHTNALFTIAFDGNTKMAVVKDVQKNPVKRIIEHVDFLEVKAGEKIEVPRAYLKGRKAEDFCAMRVRGDSMYPAFQNGDIVLVLRQSTMNHSGEIGVISYGDDEMTIKRINYVDGEDWLKLVPLNPAYPPRRIEGVDLESCHIIGIPQVLIREY